MKYLSEKQLIFVISTLLIIIITGSVCICLLSGWKIMLLYLGAYFGLMGLIFLFQWVFKKLA